MPLDIFSVLFGWLQTALSLPARHLSGFNTNSLTFWRSSDSESSSLPAEVGGQTLTSLLRTIPSLETIKQLIPRLELSTHGMLGVLALIPNPRHGCFVCIR
jgi:hypothetical protein